MLLVGGVLAKDAIWGPRAFAPTAKLRWGPLAVFTVAATLIMVEPTRHVITDQNIWPWCGNNPSYDRINSTDPYPPQCRWSATQYACTQVCCVSTWLPTEPQSSQTAYEWAPASLDFYPSGPLPGPFATLRPNGTVYFPPGFSEVASEPYMLYESSMAKPLTFYETGVVNPLRRESPMEGCEHGLNYDTGYCLLPDDLLPLKDPSKPFNETTNPRTCSCDACVPDENFLHLSVVGVLSTIVCTYLGFALLAVAVGWNANIITKLGKIRAQWRRLRGR